MKRGRGGSQACRSFCVTCCEMDLSGQPSSGAAQRRKQRRLRSWWRHEQQVDRCGPATYQHHSAPCQKTGRAGWWVRHAPNGEVPEQPISQEPGTRYCGLDDGDSVPELSGARPAPLGEPPPLERHTVEQLTDCVTVVPLLDAPVPLVVDQLAADVLSLFDTMVPGVEQVIEVPKKILDQVSQRCSLRDPQLAEQLVEVPVPSFRECAFVQVGLGEDHGTGQGCWWSHVVPRSWTTWGLLVDGGHTPHPVAPTGGTHRQPRAVNKYWAPRRFHGSRSRSRTRRLTSQVPAVRAD